MSPPTGERLVRFVGDRLRFALRDATGQPCPSGWRACLRTNLGRAALQRQEIITATKAQRPAALGSWRDVPLACQGREWAVELALAEVGYFRAKAYAIDPRGWQHWPAGPDVGISVQPNACRTANTIYCAFTRLFGPTKTATTTTDPARERQLAALDRLGYTVIPPSGKFRDLIAELPHIFDTLGCRILHLLPVNPTPTTYARFGRFGSPYAALDLTAIDPALVEFDRRTTGVDQFRELTAAVHRHGGRVFLDLVINHTAWASTLLDNHPEWFARRPDGSFASPGAWGVTWEDLVELEHRFPELREQLADGFLEWCRRGVDGFRCDAGYKVPLPVWQYVTARVRQEFPDTIFLLEGLGGGWADTENLLTEGGLQWAYSELFQNYSGSQVAGYLDHALRQSSRVGLLVHYSETHDNPRLAARGRAWSLLRNRLCALASVSGAYGFTCGAEWLADERINVHASRGLSWNNPDNLVPELARLNRLLANHPCFFDGAALTRLSPADSSVYALWRVSAQGADAVLVLANTDAERAQNVVLDQQPLAKAGWLRPASGTPEETLVFVDLLGQAPPKTQPAGAGRLRFTLPPAAVYCLAATPQPLGLAGDEYRRFKARLALALTAASQLLPVERIPAIDPALLAKWVDTDLPRFLSALTHVSQDSDGPPATSPEDFTAALAAAADQFPRVVTWQLADRTRVLLVPPQHWLLVRDSAPFRACLVLQGADLPLRAESIPVQDGHVVCFAPGQPAGDADLLLERSAPADLHIKAPIRFLATAPTVRHSPLVTRHSSLVLLTNGRGGMARLAVDLGAISSKYDCLLGANLHPRVPVDRHVLAKRARVWVNADGFISPLNAENLHRFDPGPPVHWQFLANAGDGAMVEIHLRAAMLPGRNTTVLCFSRPPAAPPLGKDLPAGREVRLTVRVDLEDRNFHAETKRNPGAEHHFTAHVRPLSGKTGFAFTPAADRQLRVYADSGLYHEQPEWCENVPHPLEQSRGMVPSGDAYSPGWFELPLPKAGQVTVVVCADPSDPAPQELALGRVDAPASSAPAPAAQTHRLLAIGSPSCPTPSAPDKPPDQPQSAPPKIKNAVPAPDPFAQQLRQALQAFVVRRGRAATVIAGYPWFLDWGRDSLVCARGLLAAGMTGEVLQIVRLLGGLERQGTLPNAFAGEVAANRDTADAPLWYGLVCEELAAALAPEQSPLAHRRSPANNRTPRSLYSLPVDSSRRTVADVLLSIAASYVRGTPNGIRLDAASGLIWSPSHFTWMDTNFPAATPREGYPVEIQALWIRLLRQLDRLGLPPVGEPWAKLAERALASLAALFWLESLPESSLSLGEREGVRGIPAAAAGGYYADVLLAKPGQPAASATPDTALRSNYLLAISLGLVTGARARQAVAAAQRCLLVPGALRSLAPLPVSPPLPIHAPDGRLLNDPTHPYCGRYEGDEDTRRKPAYHNGTAWIWTLPVFCEALVRAWDFCPAAVAAARGYLSSLDRLLAEGCLGQLPEILDGDAPHAPRGCDAQAWSVTEALRVWKLLSDPRT
jgi:glycosidase